MEIKKIATFFVWKLKFISTYTLFEFLSRWTLHLQLILMDTYYLYVIFIEIYHELCEALLVTKKIFMLVYHNYNHISIRSVAYEYNKLFSLGNQSLESS